VELALSADFNRAAYAQFQHQNTYVLLIAGKICSDAVTVNYYNLYLDPFILYFPLFDISYVIISLLLLLFFYLD
jgi:hypothetical protein